MLIRTISISVAALLLLASSAVAQPSLAPNAGAIAQDRLNFPWWKERHEAILRDLSTHSDSRLVWIGDSITNNFEKTKLPDENFLPTWKEFYEPRKALNLGYSGDTTGNVLWRLQHGEVDNLHPKAVILLIGTNNTNVGKQSALQTEVGIDAVIAELERRLPSSKILLLGLLPSAISGEKSATDTEVNRHLALVYGEHPLVTFLDVGSIFLRDGSLDTAIFYDPRLPGHPGALHPDTVGQRRLAEAIESTLARIMDEPPVISLASMTDINTALIPVTRLEQDSYDWFARHHAEMLARQGLHPQVVLIGDSITHFWAGTPYGAKANGPSAWQSAFSSLSVLNLGFGWDRIQNVLWRLQQREFDGLTSDTIVLNIGTNNLTGTDHARANTPSEVAEGIMALCTDLLQRSPSSRIVLMAIFPRRDRPDDPLRLSIAATNSLIAAKVASNPRITLLDIGSQFLVADGTLRRDLMPDGTHPNEAGYQIWGNALQSLIRKNDGDAK